MRLMSRLTFQEQTFDDLRISPIFPILARQHEREEVRHVTRSTL